MPSKRRQPALLLPGSAPWFPDPRSADADGLVAIGGDLTSARLLAAYAQGLFPWYDVDMPPLWWSPDPRAVIEAETLHVSRSLQRDLRRAACDITWNTAFSAVIRECGLERETGTWIIPDMREAYEQLHREGHAHSLEVWQHGQLVGGLYGVQCGGLFAAESMFHRVSNASKIALVVAVRSLFGAGIELFDVQFLTAHLTSLGARTISRADYLMRLSHALERKVALHGLALNR